MAPKARIAGHVRDGAGAALPDAEVCASFWSKDLGSDEVRLFQDDVLPYFDATALEVPDEIEVSDGRFSIAIVVSGAGSIEGDFGSRPVRRGETFALPASLHFRVRAGGEPVRIIRCLGPAAE